MAIKIAGAVQAKAEGDQKKADALWEEVIQQVAEDETHTDPVFDIHWFDKTYRHHFAPAKPTRPAGS